MEGGTVFAECCLVLSLGESPDPTGAEFWEVLGLQQEGGGESFHFAGGNLQRSQQKSSADPGLLRYFHIQAFCVFIDLSFPL